MSQLSCDAIFNTLSKRYSRVGVTIVNNLSDLEALIASRPDLVFLGLKFVPSSQDLRLQDPGKIWVADYLDRHGIAYTGSGHTAHEFELDKSLAKARAQAAGLNTSPFCVIKQNQPSWDMPLNFPVFIKPTSRGGGLGVDSYSLAYNPSQLTAKVRSIANKFSSDSLVEEYLPGREFSVAILKDQSCAEFLVMPIELVVQPDERGARLLSGDVKSSNSEQAVAVTDELIKVSICNLAMDVFHALGSRDYGRIDIRLDKFGRPQFLEANLIPSLISGYGSFPKACMLNIGLGYEPMIAAIAELGLAREFNTLKSDLEPKLLIGPFMASHQAPIEALA